MNIMLRFLCVTLALVVCVSSAHAGAYEQILADAENNRNKGVLEFLRLGLDVNTATREGTTLLMMAARNGNLGLVNSLLDRHANHLIRNAFGDTALMLASLQGHLAIVKRLLDKGGAQENRDGWSPLHYAAFGGHLEVARFLIAQGAKVNTLAPNSQTALMLAAGAGSLEMVKFLIDQEANVKLKDHDGQTASAIAAAKGHKRLAEYIDSFNVVEQ